MRIIWCNLYFSTNRTFADAFGFSMSWWKTTANLIKVREIPFTEAVEMIVGQAAVQLPTYEPAPKKDAPKVLLLPPASRCATHAVSYLSGRGIDSEVIDFCLSTGRLYESSGRYHNVGNRQIREKARQRRISTSIYNVLQTSEK